MKFFDWVVWDWLSFMLINFLIDEFEEFVVWIYLDVFVGSSLLLSDEFFMSKDDYGVVFVLVEFMVKVLLNDCIDGCRVEMI